MLSIVNSLMFLVLCVIWSKHGWANVLLKLVFVLLFVANTFQVLKHLGYIVKAAL